MTRVIYTQPALQDLIRLRAFLATKSSAAASKAKRAIIDTLTALPNFPESHKPVASQAHQRELVIKFGSMGYIARYRYERGGDVVVLRIRHQREDAFLATDAT